MRQFEQQVKNGIQFLDKVAPSNWRDKILPVELDMDAPTHCILGQIFGNYYVALSIWSDQLLFNDGNSIRREINEMGFNVILRDEGISQKTLVETIDELKTEWLLQLGRLEKTNATI